MKHGLQSAAYSTVKHRRAVAMGRGLPKTRLPRGLYLVHAFGPLADRDRKSCVGDDGFRVWVQRGKADPSLVECNCKFGGLGNADIHKRHFIPEAWANRSR